MGNYLLLQSSAVYSSVTIAQKFNKTRYPIEIEEVQYIEERCTPLEGILGIFGVKHSYLIATTETGRLVRYDYYNESAPHVRYDYFAYLEPQTRRKHALVPGVSVRDVTETFWAQATSRPYSPTKHNCYHVVADTYQELTNNLHNHLSSFLYTAFIETLTIIEHQAMPDSFFSLLRDTIVPILVRRFEDAADRKSYLKYFDQVITKARIRYLLDLAKDSGIDLKGSQILTLDQQEKLIYLFTNRLFDDNIDDDIAQYNSVKDKKDKDN